MEADPTEAPEEATAAFLFCLPLRGGSIRAVRLDRAASRVWRLAEARARSKLVPPLDSWSARTACARLTSGSVLRPSQSATFS